MTLRAVFVFALGGALVSAAVAADAEGSAFARARQGFTTKLTQTTGDSEEAETPPVSAGLQLVKYESAAGSLSAYVSVAPRDGRRHPAVVWLFGGFSNGIGDTAWVPGPKENDQSAAGFRTAGIVMMYPARRGGCCGVGARETFYGEVDDVIAATRHLAALDYVDSSRIYLGGHSTGGTLALLVAAASNQYRAVFALGPVGDVREYGDDLLTFDPKDVREARMRAPIRWLSSIRNPTFVFEGEDGNHDSLLELRAANKNPLVQFHSFRKGTHFTIIRPLVENLAQQIITDTGAEMTFDAKSLPRF